MFINFVSSSQVAADLAAEIIAAGGEAYPMQADVRDDGQLQAMCQWPPYWSQFKIGILEPGCDRRNGAIA